NRTVTLRDTWAKVSAGAAPSDGRPDRRRKRAAPEPSVADPGPRATIVARDAALEGRLRRYEAELGPPAEQADVLTRDRAISDFFEDTIAAGAAPRPAAKLIVNEIPRELRDRIAASALVPAAVSELVRMIETAEISASAARDVLGELIERGGDPA